MIMRRRLIQSALVYIFLMTGCGGKIHYPHYYALEIPPAPKAPETGMRLPATVAVRRFETPSYLRQGRIIYRQSPMELGFYEYHRWADDPAVMVTSGVIDALRASQLFSFVKPYDSQGRQDYLMSGRLEQLEEIDSAEAVRVAARLSAELFDLRTGAVVWTGERGETLRVESRNVDSVVAEMSHAVHKSIDGLVTNLSQELPASSKAMR
jgi:ABC-type uncharacterized transport system auxiliary subunit